jgi:RNA polymerase sigma-54 factor
MWQLGSISTRPPVREAAEVIIGNLNEDGYLIASDEELIGEVVPSSPEEDAAKVEHLVQEATALGIGESEVSSEPAAGSDDSFAASGQQETSAPSAMTYPDGLLSSAAYESNGTSSAWASAYAVASKAAAAPAPQGRVPVASSNGTRPTYKPTFTRDDLQEAIEVIRQLDPPGVACRNLRECLHYQLRYHQAQYERTGNGNGTGQILADAIAIVDQHLKALQNKQHKEIAKAINRPIEAIQAALEYIRTLDPRPGLRYNKVQPRLIEPDVAFVKHGDEWIVVMNDDDVPTLRLNPSYRKLLSKEGNDRDTRNYVKERFKSAVQLIKNIEQRKQTIMKVCYTIVARQQDFLERGIDQLKPMMIKEVAEEIGVHPSTVSRAVANKYAHTPQGVFELRYFFSESVNGPEGSGTSLLILKRRVKKLIEDEDPAKPLTDDQITKILQSQGIQVTRRTVAKYREDMKIPSTHQRRVKK